MNEDLTNIQRVIVQYMNDDSSATLPTDLMFSWYLYAFVSHLHARHVNGIWAEVVFDGPVSPQVVEIDNDSVEYCGMYSTLGGPFGWCIPLRFTASLDGQKLDFELEIGSDGRNWVELTDKKKWELVYLLSRGELTFEWKWAVAVSGTVILSQ